MKIDVVIPTLGRLNKLKNCVNSIIKAKKDHNLKLCIFFSNESEFEEFQYSSLALNKGFYYIFPHYLKEEYKAPIFWNNYLEYCYADAMCYLNDDVIVDSHMFDEIEYAFNNDYDKIIGINQYNIPKDQAVEAAFGAIGIKYADRFPNRQVFCPDYYRFYDDKELLEYAKSIGKFVFCEKAKLQHLHPAFNKELKDQTHNSVRAYLKQDRLTYFKRKQKKLLWGENYALFTSSTNKAKI